MDQYEIAEILREIALILDLQEEAPFKSMAYRKAALVIENCENLAEIIKKDQLKTLPGIGKEISKMILAVHSTGKSPYLEELKKNMPPSLIDLLFVPKLGAKKVKFLHNTFNINSLEDLEEALLQGKIPNFRDQTVQRLLKSIKKLKKSKELLWQEGMKIALSLINKLSPITKVEISGQLRRKLETISHIELLGQSHSPHILETFAEHSFVKSVIDKKRGKIKVLLKQGITAELSLTSPENLIFSFFLSTGSLAHIKDIKTQAHFLGIPFQKKTFKNTKTEEEFYQTLHMSYIPPELREGKEEVEAALSNTLPHLIEEKDLRGVFHCHTKDSDGMASLEEMAQGAKDLGWEYIGISDHSRSSNQANGMSEERVFQQSEKIKRLNQKLSSFHILTGIECDILKDGELDFPNDILKYLDFVIVSVHRFFNLKKSEMTRRVIRAIENPYTTIVGHLTGRILRYRDPYEIDIFKIIDACVANNKVIELNAYPNRLDMDWRYWHHAKERGVKCAINPDAHKLQDLQNFHIGINCARKGWLEKSDVINTFPLKKLKTFLNH